MDPDDLNPTGYVSFNFGNSLLNSVLYKKLSCQNFTYRTRDNNN